LNVQQKFSPLSLAMFYVTDDVKIVSHCYYMLLKYATLYAYSYGVCKKDSRSNNSTSEKTRTVLLFMWMAATGIHANSCLL